MTTKAIKQLLYSFENILYYSSTIKSTARIYVVKYRIIANTSTHACMWSLINIDSLKHILNVIILYHE